MTDEERAQEPIPVPGFVGWVGRHSGKLIFLVFLAVAMLEGVAMCAGAGRGSR